MPKLTDQLPAIERLRDERNRLGQGAYALRSAIARTTAALRKQQEIAGKQVPPAATVIAAARAAIAKLETRLRELAAAEQSARDRIARASNSRARVSFLERSLDALRSTLAELTRRIEKESAITPPDRTTIAKIEAQIEVARAQIADTERSLESARAEDEKLARDAERAREEADGIAAEGAEVRATIDGKEAEIGALQDATGPDTHDLVEDLASLNEGYRITKTAWKEVGARLHSSIKDLYPQPTPRETVAQMADTTPFLLLPVRIETRFATHAGERPPPPVVGTVAALPAAATAGPELWVRIYPDDIAVHTHEDDLTDREVIAGEAYWRAIFGIEKDAAGEKASRKTETWRNFVALFGPSRSVWVARQTRPANWNVLTTVASADALTFPVHDLTKTSAWTRAPRTRVLPDRFVVMLYAGGKIVKEVTGNVIPDELFLGPEPLDLDADDDEEIAEESSFVKVDGQLTFGPSFDWASNFGRAVEVGMGVRIPLTATQAAEGFEKILVLGVMASATPEAGQQLLEDLFENHQHSPKGLSLVAQGTATNNTDDEGSGYSINDSIDHSQELTGLDEPRFSELSSTDGRFLADALGIRYETLHYVFNSDNTDYLEAVAMNRALYPDTLGYYFDTLLRPILSESARDRLRDFFVANVTGRGPLAPIRIGDQPYGILLTSDFTQWAEDPTVIKRDRFPSILLAVLKHFDALWQAILPELMFAGKPGTSNADVLVNVLGLQPSSVTFAQRVGYSAEYLRTLAEFRFGGPEFDESIMSLLKEVSITTLLRAFGYQPTAGAVPEHAELLRLIYQHYTTTLDAANLIDNVPLSEKDQIREFDAVAHRNYLHWLRDTTSLDALAAQNFGGAPAPNALLYLKLRHALILQLHRSAVTWFHNHGIDATLTSTARTFHNVRPDGDLTRWEVLRAPVSVVDAGHVDRSISVADYLMLPTVDLEETAFLGQMRDALGTLASLSTARLERCFTEHLDACTYRLDAWQTGMFKGRLDALRAPTRAGGTRQKGTYLGAFGWVENVRPSPSTPAVTDVPEKLRSPKGTPLREFGDNGGFIHAPSINHATAAAVLRAGYLSHATPENPDVMAVNISSERVRRALFILQGMRNGQSLEALLGYQFERGIHDRVSANASLGVLNGFIFDIRIKFPIQRVRLAAGASGGAEETVDAYDVVNGVTLAETVAPAWAAITGADSTLLNAARIAALNAERDRLADTLDAVKDLLMAESAYQMVQGNFDRAGAVLSSVKDAHVPPDLDVIKTPRSSQFTFTQRVAIHFPRLDPLDPAAAGWPGIDLTPRASLEPGVNQWLAGVLGAPGNILCTVFEVEDDGTLVNPTTISAAQLDLQPIDLVYIVGADASTGNEGRTGASELESRVAWRYREDNGLDELSRVQIQFGAPKNQPGTATFAELMPLMRALQIVLTESRALDARDYHTSTTLGGTPGAARDFTDLQSRTGNLQSRLDAVIAAIHELPFTAAIGGTTVTTLEDAFTGLRALEDVELATLTFGFTAADTALLQQLLIALTAFGFPDAFPRTRDAASNAAKVALIAQAMDAVSAAVARGATSSKLLADAVAKAAESTERAVDLARDACQAILGQAFAVLPAFALANEADVLQSNADRARLLEHATSTLGMSQPEEEWLRSVAYVRPRVAAWERIRLLHETLSGGTLGLRALQLPYRTKDSWLAVEFPALDVATGKPFDITSDTLSIVVHGEAASAPGSLRRGILIDDWTETIPAREQSTGIAFHYNRPNAMPPQALLLAVPPEMKGHWSWDTLVGILNDTLRRAKLRAVEPHLLDARVGNPELGVLLPALVSEFQQYDLNVSLDLRLNLLVMAPILTGFYLNPNLST